MLRINLLSQTEPGVWVESNKQQQATTGTISQPSLSTRFSKASPLKLNLRMIKEIYHYAETPTPKSQPTAVGRSLHPTNDKTTEEHLPH